MTLSVDDVLLVSRALGIQSLKIREILFCHRGLRDQGEREIQKISNEQDRSLGRLIN